MNYFFINTDASSFKGENDLGIWFATKMAFTGGDFSFGEQLDQLKPDDLVLMYENSIGVVGVGTVLEKWDRKKYDAPIYYLSQEGKAWDGIDPDKGGCEYRIPVDWFLDLRACLKSVAQPPSAVNPSRWTYRIRMFSQPGAAVPHVGWEY